MKKTANYLARADIQQRLQRRGQYDDYDEDLPLSLEDMRNTERKLKELGATPEEIDYHWDAVNEGKHAEEIWKTILERKKEPESWPEDWE